MIVVVDTNVFVGACLGTGAAADAIYAPKVEFDFEDVLGRASLFGKCKLSVDEREELLEIFLASCRWTRIYFGWRPNLRDEGDNHLVELAVAGGASHVVTRNVRDLHAAELRFEGLAITTPAQFLREVSS